MEGENEWLYSDGQNSNRGTYNERINNVKSKVAHILKRYEAFENLNNEVGYLNDCLSANTNTLNSLDKKYEHISPEERQEGFNLIEKARSWIINASEQQKTLPRWNDPIITSQQIKDHIK